MTKPQNRTILLIAAGLLGLLALWLVLAPAETRLGDVIKLVYIHGALVWAGLLTFSLAGLLGLIALVLRRPSWYRGTQAAATAALLIWIVYSISAMIVTWLTWGQVIAWNEPRVRATALILIAALLMAMVTRFVAQAVFTAIVNILLGIVPWIIVHQADAIRHPVNPIGASQSNAIQTCYLLIVLTVSGLALTLVAWLWLRQEGRENAVSTSESDELV